MTLPHFDAPQTALLLWLAFGKIPVAMLLTFITRRAFSIRRRFITGAEPPAGQRQREWAGAWLSFTDALVLLLAIGAGAIHLRAPDLRNVIATVVVMILWVDLWMYFTHRWMHRSKLLWKAHRHHHLSRTVEPSTALSFSLFEKLFFYTFGWIGGASVMSWFIPMSLEGLVAYYTVYFFLSCVGHCNTVYFPERWIIPSPAVHALHHWRPAVNFGFYTTLYDRMFGTYVCPGERIDVKRSADAAVAHGARSEIEVTSGNARNGE